MIFPVGDDQVRGGFNPIFTYLFIGLNVLIFLFQLTDPEGAYICEFGAIPNRIMEGGSWLNLFTSMFMHGGWMHLIGNMLFLWVFADNIEATVGSPTFIVFYIAGGLAAHIGHFLFNTDVGAVGCCSPCQMGMACQTGVEVCKGAIPTVGASGCISAVLGAYLVMFPGSKVKVLVIYFFRTFSIAAIYFLGFWILQQFMSGFATLNSEVSSGVAWWAHIGGFLFGVAAGFFFRTVFPRKRLKEAYPKHYQPKQYEQQRRGKWRF